MGILADLVSLPRFVLSRERVESVSLLEPTQVYGLDRLVDHARELALSDRLGERPGRGRLLLARLSENAQKLASAHRQFAMEAEKGHSVPPAAEWLLDNFYIVQDQLREIRQDLTRSYYQELPKLANEPYAGYPRVYVLALELIAHTDRRVDLEVLTRFVQAYQTVAPLTLGELWAVPIMLRLGLIENLRRLIDQALIGFEQRALADRWADRLLEMSSIPATEFLVAIADLAENVAQPGPIFIVHLLERLRDQDPSVAPAIRWLEERLAAEGTTIEQVVRQENQRRAANRISVGNAITSMRTLSAVNWRAFVEETSLVERLLRTDPLAIYAQMDFATRDRYRHVVEALSKYGRFSEEEVARAVVEQAQSWDRSHPDTADRRAAHVGYYLIDRGLPQVRAQVGYRPDLRSLLREQMLALPALTYLGTIFVVSTVLVLALFLYASGVGASAAQLALIALLGISPATALAISAVNWTLAGELPPNPPPKLEFQEEIPQGYRTMVVVPALISSEEGIRRLFKALELRYLANRDPRLHFALLGDFGDSPTQHRPEDQPLLELAMSLARDLNARYGEGKEDRFYFFHRERRWNPRENTWMGWERKRGKLIEFNRLLRGATGTSYMVQVGDLSILPHIKYVITLDADTQLPLGTAKRMIGAIVHPLNLARLDPHTGRVVEGYGIIQPRTGVSPEASSRSHFAEVFAGESGLDPYSSAASLLYQDLFGTGIYVGKAVYDVDAFLAAVGSRFPENLLLSHDLIEGAYARVGTATDIQLLEDFPSSYKEYAERQHRWIRGDWQIADWILPWVPDPLERRVTNPLPLIERWKIFDNLRRSLIAPAAILLIIAAWSILPGSPALWTLVALLPTLFTAFRSTASSIGVHPAGEPWSGYIWAILEETDLSGARALLSIILLPYNALLTLDAVAKVAFRRLVSRRRLLEWRLRTAAERHEVRAAAEYWVRMWPAPGSSLIFLAFLLFTWPNGSQANSALLIAAPLLVLWFLSPLVAYWSSRPLPPVESGLREPARRELRIVARRIWRYFEEFAGPTDNWLPADNYQESRQPPLAQQTSPTNIGFLFLSTLAAYDFGYIEKSELVERLEKTYDTMDRLEKYRGHFLNWYNTRTLLPLLPEYVSTADSGNLAASLIALKQACLKIAEDQSDGPRHVTWRGLEDTTAALQAALHEIEPQQAGSLSMMEELAAEIEKVYGWLQAEQSRTGHDEARAGALLEELSHSSAQILKLERGIEKELGEAHPVDLKFWCERLADHVERLAVEQDEDPPPSGAESSTRTSGERLRVRLRALAQHAQRLVDAMDFAFLYDKGLGVFSVGYNVAAGRLDSSFFDLLASEARLASLFAISQGEAPAEHWNKLSRPLTRIGGKLVLLSWGGTMFEYLMPALLTPNVRQTLLQQSLRGAVDAQIRFGKAHGIPWGISESGFYAFDFRFNYQYRMFGVPQLALKREIGENLVVAPYATFLAMQVAPLSAVANMQRLAAEGASGSYGFYEALDYTPSRRPKGERAGIVRQYMAHHQGMSLVALDNLLNACPMEGRFTAEPGVAAVGLLLQERIPRHAPLVEPQHQTRPVKTESERLSAVEVRRFKSPHTPAPRTQLLSNGNYTVVLTNSGGGYSAYKDWAITRWREDATRDNWGSFCYVKELNSGRVWSTAYQPTRVRPDSYEVNYSNERAEFRRRDGKTETRIEIFISPEDDVEIRRVSLTNHDQTPRELEVTSFAELVLDNHKADVAHPAFGKLLVESEFLVDRRALVFKRRSRTRPRPELWAVHQFTSDESDVKLIGHESDRAKFLGRGHDASEPDALQRPLTNTTGAPLDPVMALRCRVRIKAGETVQISFVTGACESREGAQALIDKYADPRGIERASELSYIHNRILLHHLGISPEQVVLFQRLASRVLYSDPALRAKPEILIRNRKGQSGLWPYGISGDNPIVLVRVSEIDELSLVRELLLAHEYWRMNRFTVDLVIVNEHPTAYASDVFNRIQGMIDTSLSRPSVDKPGGVFVRQRDQMPDEDMVLLQTVARVVLQGELGSLPDQLQRTSSHPGEELRVTRDISRPQLRTRPQVSRPPPRSVVFDNGMGGFSQDGSEYVIKLEPGQWTPAPWVNVLANPSFGCLVSEAGLGYTWAINSQTNKLTPWSNDPVCDPPPEAIYLRDEVTNEIWSPTLLPIRTGDAQVVRHGAGYTVFEQMRQDLTQEVTVFVPMDDPIKIIRFKLRNTGTQSRRLGVTFYSEWVLGTSREEAQRFVLTEQDDETGALLARNAYNAEFGSRVAFAAVVNRRFSFTSDRAEFIGRNGTPGNPIGLFRTTLSGRVGAGLDPCAAIQTAIELGPNQEQEIVFLLGQAEDREHIRDLIGRYREATSIQRAFVGVKREWADYLEAVQVKTPDQGFDLMINRWLLYQTLACRLWGRTAFYQSGGAFGFRDQLQDSMALLLAAPILARDQILLAAAHQFLEGDVQHWWHPPTDAGVRTRISDDLLWLPYVTDQYLMSTGDETILDEQVQFLSAPLLEPWQDDAYGKPTPVSPASIYEHCLRALDHSLRFGAHGLPLMGRGDWNDGMNSVGKGGKGESVWLGWFLYSNLDSFARICERRGDAERAARYRQTAAQLQSSLEEHGWDGKWYRRAFFDDGTPLGSAASAECKIDSIAQSWAVISGAASPEHKVAALKAADEHLVQEQEGLVLLLTPPFDHSDPSPGYIQAYVPGVRENGGQYSHAALWLVLAHILNGNGDRAGQLYNLLNPIQHSLTPDGAACYRVEPYIVAADIYAHPQHTGRGGWTWYTGSAGWMYRIGVEALLGLKRRGSSFMIDPCIPRNWPGYRITFRHGQTRYEINVENPGAVNRGVERVELDGEIQANLEIPLRGDKATHQVRVVLGGLKRANG